MAGWPREEQRRAWEGWQATSATGNAGGRAGLKAYTVMRGETENSVLVVEARSQNKDLSR